MRIVSITQDPQDDTLFTVVRRPYWLQGFFVGWGERKERFKLDNTMYYSHFGDDKKTMRRPVYNEEGEELSANDPITVRLSKMYRTKFIWGDDKKGGKSKGGNHSLITVGIVDGEHEYSVKHVISHNDDKDAQVENLLKDKYNAIPEDNKRWAMEGDYRLVYLQHSKPITEEEYNVLSKYL